MGFQKKKKDRIRSIERQIPDAPTLEEFECLLGESPTNYPRGEGIENMESELHSAAIDTEFYENVSNNQHSCNDSIKEEEKEKEVELKFVFHLTFCNSFYFLTLF